VLVYPVRQRQPGPLAEPLFVGNGSDVLRATTGNDGTFSISVPTEAQYHVCTQGAPAPLLDQCSVGQFAAVSISSTTAGQLTRFSLIEGVPITVSVDDTFGRLTPGCIDVSLSIDSARAAPVASQQINSGFASFIFTVPAHATGRVLVRSSIAAFVGGGGQEIAVGVPDLPWDADTSPTITLTAQ